MSSHVRFAAAASLIAFGSAIVVGALVLVPPAVERFLIVRTDIANPRATACARQPWLPSDQDCASQAAPQRDLARVAEAGAFKVVAADPTPSAEQVMQQWVEGVPAAGVLQGPVVSQGSSFPQQPADPRQPAMPREPANPQEPAAPRESAAPQEPTMPREPAAPAEPAAPREPSMPRGAVPTLEAAPPRVAAVPQAETPAGGIVAREDKPSARPGALRRQATARPASDAQVRESQVRDGQAREVPPRRPAPKKTIQAKRSKDEALRAVRRFDAPQEIPVTAYAADGQQRTIMIRPTSIQDVYYYSAR